MNRISNIGFNIFSFVLIITVFIIVCNGDGNTMEDKRDSENTTIYNNIKDIPASIWDNLSLKKIYFGHQSVGYNIMDGLKDIIKNYPQIKLNVVETRDDADFRIGIFAHSLIGENEKPITKINGFSKLIDEELGSKVDIAFFKFCYVDITYQTDINKLFLNYKKMLLNSKKKNPKIIFIHATAPLRKVQTGPKAWIKKIIGKPIGEYENNIKRNQFNKLILNEYAGIEPIYDIARVESTLPDGTRLTFDKNGNKYYTIVPEYTIDGRHLNEIGRTKAAEELLLLLVKLVNQSSN